MALFFSFLYQVIRLFFKVARSPAVLLVNGDLKCGLGGTEAQFDSVLFSGQRYQQPKLELCGARDLDGTPSVLPVVQFLPSHSQLDLQVPCANSA